MIGFGISVVVGPSDIDHLGHANNVNYLRWMLDAAMAHWDHLKAHVDPTVVDGVGWVVMRHELDYLAAAFLGERLEIHTWVPTCTATTCERLYEVIRAADQVVLARGASSYCVVDLATAKPRRLTEGLRVAIGSPEVVKRLRSDRVASRRPDRIVSA